MQTAPDESRAAALDAAESFVVMGDNDDDSQVHVMVQRGYLFTDDDFIVHEYRPGEQWMPRIHFEHPYAAAHGVVELND